MMLDDKICFVMMPFSDSENPGDNKWTDLFDNNIRPAVEDADLGYTCIRAANPHGNFMIDILNKIASADVGIAVLTEMRPNIMYELGVRHALRRKTIMLAEKFAEIPSDLQAYIADFYNVGTQAGRDKLKKAIRDRLQNFEVGELPSDSPVSDYLQKRVQGIHDDWLENKDPKAFIPRLTEVLPSYAFGLEPTLSKVAEFITDVEERAQKNEQMIEQQRLDQVKPEVQKRAAEIAIDSKFLRQLEIGLSAAVLQNMMTDAYKRGDYVAALSWIDQQVQKQPKNAQAWSNRGAALGRLNRHEEALKNLDKAIELNPKDAQVWTDRGAALDNLNRLEEALKSHDKAVELDPKDAQVWTNRGAALSKLNRLEEALKNLDKAVELDPKLAQAWFNRGVVLGRLNRHEEALKSHDKAVELDPKLASAWIQKGYALFFLRRFSESSDAFTEAIKNDDGDATARNNLGFVLEAQGRNEEALMNYDKALVLDERHPQALYNRGSVLRKMGRDDEAAASTRQALKIELNVGKEIEAQKRQVGIA